MTKRDRQLREYVAEGRAYGEDGERLRLTDAEREAVEDSIRCCEYVAAYKPMESRANLVASAAALRSLLERTR